MKSLLFLLFTLLTFSSLFSQTDPKKTMGEMKDQLTELKDPSVIEAHVVTVDGTIYNKLCIAAKDVKKDGCDSLEEAWKNGRLYVCSDRVVTKAIPKNDKEVFTCYIDDDKIHIRILPESALEEDKTVD